MKIGVIEIVFLFVGFGFLAIVFYLIPLIQSLTRASKELESTLSNAKKLIINLNELSKRIDKEFDSIEELTQNSIKVLSNLSHTLSFINKKLLVPSFGAISLFSGLKYGFSLISKKKKKGKIK